MQWGRWGEQRVKSRVNEVFPEIGENKECEKMSERDGEDEALQRRTG